MFKTLNTFFVAFLCSIVLFSCTESEVLTQQSATEGAAPSQQALNEMMNGRTEASVSISNAGFESGFSDWVETDPAATSGEANSGSGSAKISGTGGKLEQTVSVTANTDYELSAYVKGGWRIGVVVNGNRNTRSGTASDWTQQIVTFNSGSATSITIIAEYANAEGRFDDFALESTGSSSGSSAPIGQTIWLRGYTGEYASAKLNTTDNPVQANVTAVVTWESFDVIDAGDGMIALKAYNNKYVCAEKNTSNNPVRANRTAIGAWEKFTWVDLGNGEISLQANANGKFVRVATSASNNPLRANGNTAGNTDATFTWGQVGTTPPPVVDPPVTGGDYATDIIPSLVDWKLTLPVDSNGDDSSDASSVNDRNTNPEEIKDNNLIDYEKSPYFYAENDEVVFRAHCAGATTSGSKYPRCELRQRVGGGDNYWSVNDYQRVQTVFRVTEVPVEKPELSMVQIHGPDDEPLRVQYHANTGLYIIWNESNKDTGNALAYSLGERVRVTVEVDEVTINGVTTNIMCKIENLSRGTSYTKRWVSSDNTGYFKVGCYTQSSIFLNEIKGSGYTDEPLNAAGEMRVESITLTETY